MTNALKGATSQIPGCKVLTTVLPWERKEHLTSKGISCYTLDITQDESVRELAKTIQKDFGNSLDILVNNAYVILVSIK